MINMEAPALTGFLSCEISLPQSSNCTRGQIETMTFISTLTGFFIPFLIPIFFAFVRKAFPVQVTPIPYF
jgi:hypothetical protein